MRFDFTANIERDGYTYTLELTNYTRHDAHRAMAEWLVRIGYKPPRFFGLVMPNELRIFPKEVHNLMRRIAK